MKGTFLSKMFQTLGVSVEEEILKVKGLSKPLCLQDLQDHLLILVRSIEQDEMY